MRIKPIVLFVFLAVAVGGHGQTTSDCTGAISVCDGYYEEDTAPLSTGSTIEIPFGSCNPTESNSIWYVFTVQEDGLLSFILDPTNDNNDYDWGLYDITTNGCAGISGGSSPEVSCNSWGVIGVNGPTGISTQNGGTGNSNGPGNLNGPPFNADLPVTAGTTFALAVMNWSASLEGYTLDFGESTASIYDDDPPFLVSVTPNCSGSELTVVFSENILVSSMQLMDFSVSGPGGNYALSNFIASQGALASSDNTYIFDMSDPLDVAGSYTFTLEEGADFIQDACGNSASGNIVFDVSGLMTFSTDVMPACNGEGGSIEVMGITGGVAPYDIFLDGAVQPDPLFEALTPGTYAVSIEDANGCELSLNVPVENFVLWVDAGTDSIPCALAMNLEASFNAGTFSWTYPPEIQISDNANPGALVSSVIEGDYLLTATAQLGECVVTDLVMITLSVPLLPDVTTTRASCHSVCDGAMDVISNAGNLTVFLGENSSTGNEVHFGALCAGDYTVLAVNFAGCQYSEEVEVWQPPLLQADFEATPQPVQIPESTITFDNLSLNDSISHWMFGVPMLGESFDSVAVFSFPYDAGGVYPVTLIVTDGFGCTATIVKDVIIQDNFLVFAPNTFTPDYDGINDVFQFRFSYLPEEYLLTIIDRWGEVVFSSTNPLEAWTGNVREGNFFASNAVYNWILEVKGNEPDKHILTGHVLVIR